MARRRGMVRPRGRRSSGADLLAGPVIAGAIAIAWMGIYLVAIAAAALAAWVAQLVIRQTRAQIAERAAARPDARGAAPPEQAFHEVMPVDPAAFADPSRAQTEAVKVFAAWAAALPRAPRRPGDAVRALQHRRRWIGRLTSIVEGRRLAWRRSPYRGRERPAPAPLDPAALDAWNPPADLRGLSRHIASCWTCRGDGRVDCERCGGGGRARCGGCGGAGKVEGIAASGARRLLNCRTCRGKGDLACGACARGRVDCPTCERAKKLESWLEVDASRREDVQVEPDGDVTRAYRWGKDGASATRLEISRDAHVVGEVSGPGRLGLDELARAAPPARLSENAAALEPRLEPGERIEAQSFVLLDVPSIEITYGAGGATQAIELHGLRMLAPPPSTDQVFHRRARSLRRAALALAAVPLGAAIVYLSRGEYYRSPATAGLLAATALAALVAYRALWNATLGRAVARRWLAAALVPATAAAWLAILAEPSREAARRHLEAGRLAPARAELTALGSSDDPDLAPLWADLALREALAEPDLDRAAARASRIPAGTAAQVRARSHVDALALAAARASLDAGALPGARARLGQLSASVRAAPEAVLLEGRLALAEGAACLAREDWPCAVASARRARALGLDGEGRALEDAVVAALRARAEDRAARAESAADLEGRVAAQQAAFAAWSDYHAFAPGPDPERLVTLRARHEKDAAQLARSQEAERVRLAAEERRRLAAEARDARRREAQERREAWSSRGLRCCDGTLSPSCSCGGSHRGCCSHHGGVCGCE